ncbi:MAG: hypothetical protein ACO3VF_10860, partial [Tamlana sp.]
MSDKKHIDRLFQEGFKDFEATPNDAVWKRIEAELDQKKKKRRVIPIWWRYAGVAALLLLFLTLGFNYFNNSNNLPENQIVDTENTSAVKTNSEKENNVEDLENTMVTNTVVSENNYEDPKERTNSKENESALSTNKFTPSNNTLIPGNSSSKNENESNINKALKTNQTLINNPIVATVSEDNIVNESPQNKTTDKTAIALNESSENRAIDESKEAFDALKAKQLLKGEASKNKTIIANTNNENSANSASKNSELTIEEVLEKNKDIIEEEKFQNRWSVAPNAAPVYFNTLNGGSSIGAQFNDNSKTGNVNMSYGLSASYAINNKLSIRSGINKVNLGYNTNDVIVFQSAGVSSSRSALQNVNTSNSNTQADGFVSTTTFESLNAANIPESFSTTNTSINQALGYIEIPLEIQYMLSDKKLGINVIGGLSSFFLNNNEIFSEAENGNRTFLGEANNVNKVSYSANLGLGLNYKMSKKINLNLEPIFKYQINTFKNTSGNFTPFFIGVYTGFAI